MNTKTYELEVSRKILNSFDITLENYLKFDKDVRISLLRAYWNDIVNNHDNLISDNSIKTKVLSMLRKK